MILFIGGITLSPELEQYATEAVEQGRYHDVSEVVQAGLSLLKQAKAERAKFVTSLEEARAEAERDGFFTAEEVHRDMSATLDAMDRSKE